MDVSIIIVNYNTVGLTLQCLDSIYKWTHYVSFEIIVVDNASGDSSVQAIKRRYPQIKIIANSKNLGFGKANNIGASIAKGKYLFFLNSDTYLNNNAVKYLFDFMENRLDNSIAVVGGLLKNDAGNYIHSSYYFPTPINVLRNAILSFCGVNVWHEKHHSLDKGYWEVDYVTGADLFIIADIYTKLGGFDENFFLYYEETDLQKRMTLLGYKSCIISSPSIVHLAGGSCKGITLEKYAIIGKSLFLYMKKHFSKIAYLSFRSIYSIMKIVVILPNLHYSLKSKSKYISALLH